MIKQLDNDSIYYSVNISSYSSTSKFIVDHFSISIRRSIRVLILRIVQSSVNGSVANSIFTQIEKNINDNSFQKDLVEK